jgi:UDP-glucuronate decarboxylase
VKRLCGSAGEIKYEPLPSDDPRQRKPDISRAIKLLNWEPVVSLTEGLQLTITDFAERLERGRDAESLTTA